MLCQIVHAVETNGWYLMRCMKSWVGVGQHTCLAQQKNIVKAYACVASTLNPA